MKKIFFVQGICTTKKDLDFIRKYFENRGYKFICIPCFYFFWDHSKIERFKEVLSLKIKKNLDQNPNNNIILSHSFGGIITQSLDKEILKNFGKIFMIAVPNMHPFHEIKRKLGYNEPEKGDKRYYSFSFIFDHLVPHFSALMTCNHEIIFDIHRSILDREKPLERIFRKIH